MKETTSSRTKVRKVEGVAKTGAHPSHGGSNFREQHPRQNMAALKIITRVLKYSQLPHYDQGYNKAIEPQIFEQLMQKMNEEHAAAEVNVAPALEKMCSDSFPNQKELMRMIKDDKNSKGECPGKNQCNLGDITLREFLYRYGSYYRLIEKSQSSPQVTPILQEVQTPSEKSKPSHSPHSPHVLSQNLNNSSGFQITPMLLNTTNHPTILPTSLLTPSKCQIETRSRANSQV